MKHMAHFSRPLIRPVSTCTGHDSIEDTSRGRTYRMYAWHACVGILLSLLEQGPAVAGRPSGVCLKIHLWDAAKSEAPESCKPRPTWKVQLLPTCRCKFAIAMQVGERAREDLKMDI